MRNELVDTLRTLLKMDSLSLKVKAAEILCFLQSDNQLQSRSGRQKHFLRNNRLWDLSGIPRCRTVLFYFLRGEDKQEKQEDRARLLATA